MTRTAKYLQPNKNHGRHLSEEDANAATLVVGSDRYPCSIIAMGYDFIILQADHAECISGSGHDGSAKYAYFKDDNGTINLARLCNRGKNKGRFMYNRRPVCVGSRELYQDPSF